MSKHHFGGDEVGMVYVTPHQTVMCPFSSCYKHSQQFDYTLNMVKMQLSVYEMDARMKSVPSLLLLIALEQVSGAWLMVN